MMLRWHLAAAVLGLATLLPGTQPASAFGALAIDSNRGPSFGFSYDESSPASARLQAVTKCGIGCRAVIDFRNTCAAYAADQSRDNGPFGWAYGPTAKQAQDSAMRYCRQYGGTSCRVRVWACENFRARDSRASASYVSTTTAKLAPSLPAPSRPPVDTNRRTVDRLTTLLDDVVSKPLGTDRDAPPSSDPPLFGSNPPPPPPPPQTTARTNNLFDDAPRPPQINTRTNNLFDDPPARPPSVRPPPGITPPPSITPPQNVTHVVPPQTAKPSPTIIPNVAVPNVVANDGFRKVALVVGNDRYEALPVLQKAANDARAVGDKLAALGFEVIRIENASRRNMNQKLVEFAGKVGRGDTALFFFAGHGVEIRGINYLLPTDTPAARDNEEALITSEGIPADGIIEQLQERGAKVTMLVLDACRDNPFKKPGTRGVGGTRGLGLMTAPEGVFVLYSAGVGQTALDRLADNDPNPNSVFTRTLVRMLGQPGLTVQTMAKQTQAEVHRLAKTVRHVQMPAYYDQILGQYALVPARQ